MSKVLIYSLIYLIGVIISSFSQILLKKSADVNNESFIKTYLNWRVIFAYSIFFLAMIISLISYKYIPLTFGPVLETTEYIFVALLGYFILKEKINKSKLIGLILIIAGVVVFTI